MAKGSRRKMPSCRQVGRPASVDDWACWQDRNPGEKDDSGEIADGELAEDKLADPEGSGENEQQPMAVSPMEIGVREYLVDRSLLPDPLP